MSFAGYWVHGSTGEIRPIHDHAYDVLHHHAHYGLTHDEVSKIVGGKTTFNSYETAKESARGRLIQAAAEKGWVRVRQFRNQTNFQLHGRAASRLSRVADVMKKRGVVHPNSQMFVSDLATGFEKTYDGHAELKAAAKSGEIPDHSGGKPVGRDAVASLGKTHAKAGVPSFLPDHQKRTLMRQGLLRAAGIAEGTMLQRHHVEGAVRELVKPHEAEWKASIHQAYKDHAEHQLKTFNEFWSKVTPDRKFDSWAKHGDKPPTTPFVKHPHDVLAHDLHPRFGAKVHAAKNGTASINHEHVAREADAAFHEIHSGFIHRATEKLTHIAGQRGLKRVAGHLKLGHGAIEGEIHGHIDDKNHFALNAEVKTNYRYGEHAANRHMTQYTQYPFTVKHAHVEGQPVSKPHADDLAVRWGGVPLHQAERSRIEGNKAARAAWTAKRDDLEKHAHAWRDIHDTVKDHAKKTLMATALRDPKHPHHKAVLRDYEHIKKANAHLTMQGFPLRPPEEVYAHPSPLPHVRQAYPKHAERLGLNDWPTPEESHAKLQQARAALAAHKEQKP